jgi:hypothetical protein
MLLQQDVQHGLLNRGGYNSRVRLWRGQVHALPLDACALVQKRHRHGLKVPQDRA